MNKKEIIRCCASGSAAARETVRRNFLMSRLLEDWLDLLSDFGQRLEQ